MEQTSWVEICIAAIIGYLMLKPFLKTLSPHFQKPTAPFLECPTCKHQTAAIEKFKEGHEEIEVLHCLNPKCGHRFKNWARPDIYKKSEEEVNQQFIDLAHKRAKEMEKKAALAANRLINAKERINRMEKRADIAQRELVEKANNEYQHKEPYQEEIIIKNENKKEESEYLFPEEDLFKDSGEEVIFKVDEKEQEANTEQIINFLASELTEVFQKDGNVPQRFEVQDDTDYMYPETGHVWTDEELSTPDQNNSGEQVRSSANVKPGYDLEMAELLEDIRKHLAKNK